MKSKRLDKHPSFFFDIKEEEKAVYFTATVIKTFQESKG